MYASIGATSGTSMTGVLSAASPSPPLRSASAARSKRRASSFNTQRVDHIYEDPHVEHQHFVLHYGDLADSSNLTRILQQVQPDEVYNLGAQSHVAVSFEAPEYTADVDALGTLRLLEAIRFLGMEKSCRFYQASTSELYGLVQETPQKETTPFYPRSPYAVAKLYAYWITVNYREAYGMYACNGIPPFARSVPRGGQRFGSPRLTPCPESPRCGSSRLTPRPSVPTLRRCPSTTLHGPESHGSPMPQAHT